MFQVFRGFFMLAALWLVFQLTACLPAAIPYPQTPADSVVARATRWSDSLEAYIERWTLGLVPDTIPDALIPQGISDSRRFYLKHPDSVTAAETWAVRPAKPINLDSLYGGIPDPRISYLFLGTALAPFGSKVIVEGQFPHCRFFSLQISPPLDGKEYYAQRQFGPAEVSIVDADIEPFPGHTNPFRVGANRSASLRSYRVSFDLATGNATALNGAGLTYPYRQAQNNRTGALLVYQGPLGHQTLAGTPLPNPGDWNLGCLWVRIYDPDLNTDVWGGVPKPKVYFELPNGRRYFIGSDFSALQRRADTTAPNQVTNTAQNPNITPADGWAKSWGITRSILNGICQANGWDSAARVREIDLGWTGRGEFLPSPASIEPHATTNNYISYIGRAVTVPPGYVAVLTGKMPTFPSTRNGEAVMTAGDVRYWSICGIDQDPFSPLPATTVNSIYDADVTLDSQRNYVIAFSRAADRPVNAQSSQGVSWVNWGTQSYLGLLMRWLCIAPDWRFSLAPQEHNLDFSHSDISGVFYDRTLLGENWRHGFMRCYLPTIHLFTKAEFEALGNNLRADRIPIWLDSSNKARTSEARLGSVVASGTLDATPVNAPRNAIDGQLSTAWSSPFGQTQASITLDLGSVKTLSAVKLHWDMILFPRRYQVQHSLDNVNYTTLQSVTMGNGQVDLMDRLPLVQTRFIRLLLTEPNIWYYRLLEFEAYTTDCACEAPLEYIFEGSGLWSDPLQWKNGLVPPTDASADMRIIIDPMVGGFCHLTHQQRIRNKAVLVVRQQKRFRISGNLDIQRP